MGSRRVFALLAALFGIFGLMWGVWSVLLADLVQALSLGPAEVGLALMVVSISAIPVMLGGGLLADTLGLRLILLVGTVLLALSFGSLSWVGSLAAFVVLLLVMGAGSGLFDLAMNAQAIRYEQTSGRMALTPLHACFSAGGALGALTSGGMLSADSGFRQLYVVVAVALLVVVALVLLLGFPAGRRAAGEAKLPGKSLIFRNGAVVLLGLAVSLAFVSESALEGWSSIYLRNALGLTALVGGGGVAGYYASMAVGRLLATGIVARFGPRRVLMWAGGATGVCMLLSLVTTEPLIIIVGFVGVGFALSSVAPTALSLAGQAAPGNVTAASSLAITFGYVGFLTGPPIIGFLADVISLRLALGVVALAGLGVMFLARMVSQMQRPEPRAVGEAESY